MSARPGARREQGDALSRPSIIRYAGPASTRAGGLARSRSRVCSLHHHPTHQQCLIVAAAEVLVPAPCVAVAMRLLLTSVALYVALLAMPGARSEVDASTGCTSATPLLWISQPVVQNETALVVATTEPAAAAARRPSVPMRFARLCPQQQVPAGSKRAACTFVPLRDKENMPPSEPRNRSIAGCAFTIPPAADVHAWSVSLCASPEPASCAATTARPLNVAQVDWMQGDRGNSSEAGGWLRIFGSALAFGPSDATSNGRIRCIPEREAAAGTTASRVRLRRTGSSEWTELKLSAASCYAITTYIPEDLLPGTYEVSVHNGINGNRWGQRGETVATVVAKRRWPTDVFDVVKLGSVWKAIEAAKNNSGGIVHFPRGTIN